MKKVNNEKETIMKLYRDNISEIIWTHKIQATILDDLKKKNNAFSQFKSLYFNFGKVEQSYDYIVLGIINWFIKFCIGIIFIL